MTVLNSKDLDAQMGRYIDPNSVPRHNGGDSVHMQPVIARGSEHVTEEQGAGRYGAAMFSEQEVGGQDFFGSKTIISVSDAPPLMKEHDPVKKPITLPVVPMPLAMMPMPAVPVVPVVKAVALVAKQAPSVRSAAEMLAAMGLNKPRMG